MHASDEDIGANGDVTYNFGPRTPSEFRSLFSIDDLSGVVTLISTLDYEVASEYSLEVSAKDGNPDSIATIAVLDILLQDQNDHQPEIIVNSPTPEGHLKVNEEQEVPEFVGHITVLDRDTGNSGVFSCALSAGPFQLESINPNINTEFKIMSTVVFDREEKHQYEITLTCRDNGQPSLESFKDIIIDITDVNDHIPTFERSVYTASIQENNIPGTEVIQITATDGDIGVNSDIRYFLSTSPTGAIFDVDTHTGQVTAHTRLDYEEHTSIQMTLTARDLGDPSKSSTSVLFINVDDIDDAVPEFELDVYTFYVPEEHGSGLTVGNVTAHDPDTMSSSSNRNSFMYSLDPRHNPGNMFAIRPYTGEIFTSRVLDREVQQSYSLRVLAINANQSVVQIGSARISIIVTDINDNAPVLEFPSLTNNTLHVTSDLEVGQVFGKVMAHDRDDGSSLNFRFLSGNDHGLFVVAQYSGEVSLAQSLSLVEEQTFHLVVAVRDGGHQTAASLNVVLTMTSGHTSRSKSSDVDRNLLIVIVIACVTAIIVVLLLVAIVAVLRRRHGNNKYNYKARLVDQAKARANHHQPIGMSHNNDSQVKTNQSADSIQLDQQATTQQHKVCQKLKSLSKK